MSLLSEAGEGTGIASSFFGLSGAQAASQGAQDQAAADLLALNVIRNNLSPFVNLGGDAAQQAQSLIDPNAQVDFLANNPVFQNLGERQVRETLASAASRGKLGAGGTAADIQSGLINLGNQLINQQFNRLNPLISMGQASAARQGAGSVNLLTGIGNAQAAGLIGAQNSLSQGSANAVQLGTTLASLFGGQNNTINTTGNFGTNIPSDPISGVALNL